jgi:hypothetical protein
MIKLCSNGEIIKVTRSRTKYKRVVGHLTYCKSTFPLILGYAMTAHQAQGATVQGKVFLALSEAFVP